MVGSHRYLTCVPDKNVATADFVWYYLQTREGLEQVQAASPGSADRNRTLGVEALGAIEVPTPSLEQQRWFDSLQAKAGEARLRNAEAGRELDLLIPSMLHRAFNGGV
jgi:type I restriction enzyme S subunit